MPPFPQLLVTDMKQEAIQLFKDKAVKRRRLTKEEVDVSGEMLMYKSYVTDEHGYLIKITMLAFYERPEK